MDETPPTDTVIEKVEATVMLPEGAAEVAQVKLPETTMTLFTQNQVSPRNSGIISRAYSSFFAELDANIKSAMELKVASMDDVEGTKKARALRLQFKNARVSSEKVRKILKDDMLRTGRVVDLIAADLAEKFSAAETHLEMQETFIAREQARIVRERKAARLSIIVPLAKEANVYLGEIDLDSMLDSQFQELVDKLTADCETVRKEKAAREAESLRTQLQGIRLAKIGPLVAQTGTAIHGIDFGSMTDAEFQTMVEGQNEILEQRAKAAAAENARRNELRSARREVLLGLKANPALLGDLSLLTEEQFAEAVQEAKAAEEARVLREKEAAENRRRAEAAEQEATEQRRLAAEKDAEAERQARAAEAARIEAERESERKLEVEREARTAAEAKLAAATAPVIPVPGPTPAPAPVGPGPVVIKVGTVLTPSLPRVKPERTMVFYTLAGGLEDLAYNATEELEKYPSELLKGFVDEVNALAKKIRTIADKYNTSAG